MARQDLDRDSAAQPRILRPEDLAHATRADGREDFVRTESFAGSERHLDSRALV
jgi:hypothetical protein